MHEGGTISLAASNKYCYFLNCCSHPWRLSQCRQSFLQFGYFFVFHFKRVKVSHSGVFAQNQPVCIYDQFSILKVVSKFAPLACFLVSTHVALGANNYCRCKIKNCDTRNYKGRAKGMFEFQNQAERSKFALVRTL